MATRRQLALRIIAAVAGGLAALALIAVLVLQSPWGLERVRRYVESQLAARAAGGRVTVGRASGGVLRGVTLHDVRITDSAGAPVLDAPTLSARYTLLDLTRGRLDLRDAVLDHPTLTLRRTASGEWNLKRIFASRPRTAHARRRLVLLSNLRIRGGTILVRTPWAPAPSLIIGARPSSGTHRFESAGSLASDAQIPPAESSRLRIERSPAGLERVIAIEDVDATLPRIRLSDPDSAGILVVMSSFSARAWPYRDIPAEVRDLRATLRLSHDTLRAHIAHLDLAGSHLVASVGKLPGGALTLRGRLAPLDARDLRWAYPALPSDGSATGVLGVTSSHGQHSVVVRDLLARLERATISGDVAARVGRSDRIDSAAIVFRNVETGLIARLAHGTRIGLPGTLSGDVAGTGWTDRANLSAHVDFVPVVGAASRVAVSGELGTSPVAYARALRVTATPLRLALVRDLSPSLAHNPRLAPLLDGLVSGTAIVTGNARGGWSANGDVAHVASTGESRLVGRGEYDRSSDVIRLDVRALPLSMRTVGVLAAPAAQLRGAVAGPVRIDGTLSNMRIFTDLDVAGGGALRVEGTAGIPGGAMSGARYDLESTVRRVDLSRLSARAPRSDLSGTLSARGAGTDPAIMRADFATRLIAPRVDTTTLDSVVARVHVGSGILCVDTAAAGAPGVRAAANGALGLVAGRGGELRYSVRVDSLEAVERWLPALRGSDTSTVNPRPARIALAEAKARDDSTRRARSTEVERMVTGAPPPTLQLTLPPARLANALGGSLALDGTAFGRIGALATDGRLHGTDVVARGSYVHRLDGQYAVSGIGTDTVNGHAELEASDLDLRGFGYRHASVAAAGGAKHGEMTFAVVQDDRSDYRGGGSWTRTPSVTRLQLDTLALRFDTTAWRLTQPAVVGLTAKTIALDSLVLRADDRRWMRAHLRLGDSRVDAAVDAQGVQIRDAVTLMQSTSDVDGLVTANVRASGAAERPVVHAQLDVTDARVRDRKAPALSAIVDFAEQSLSGKASLRDSANRTLVVADGRLGLALTLSRSPSAKLLDAPFSVDARADSLPLEILPAPQKQIRGLEGVATGQLAVRGTPHEPAFGGAMQVRRGAFELLANRVHYSNVGAALRLAKDTLHLDSVVAHADGTLRVDGTIAIADRRRPVFALQLDASDLQIMGGAKGRMHADAELTAIGPLDTVHVVGRTALRRGFFNVRGPEADQIRAWAQGDPIIFALLDTTRRSFVSDPAPVPDSGRAGIVADVTLRVGRDTWIRSPSKANLEFMTVPELRVRYDTRRKTGIVGGLVRLGRGDLAFRSQRLILDRGSVTFEPVPNVAGIAQIVASRTPFMIGREETRLEVIQGGELSHPRVSVESAPETPIPQWDLSQYLSIDHPATALEQQQVSSLSGVASLTGRLEGNLGALARRQLGDMAMGTMLYEIGKGAAASFTIQGFSAGATDVAPELAYTNAGSMAGGALVIGRYINLGTLVAAELRPRRTLPGVRLEHYFSPSLRLDAAWEPRFTVPVPLLGDEQEPGLRHTLGAFLVKEWFR